MAFLHPSLQRTRHIHPGSLSAHIWGQNKRCPRVFLRCQTEKFHLACQSSGTPVRGIILFVSLQIILRASAAAGRHVTGNTECSWVISTIRASRQLVESIMWYISNCLPEIKSKSGIDTLVPAAIHPPSSLLRYLPHSWRKIGRPIPYYTDYWEPPPNPLPTQIPPTPILPFTLQQPTATRPRCSWIIQAGRQPIALSFVGEDAATKGRQLWQSSPDQKTMVTSVGTRRSRRLKLRAKSHICKSGPISVTPNTRRRRFHFGRCLSPQMFGQERISLVKLFLSFHAKRQG